MENHPGHTAVLTMELERGVVGDLAAITALRDAAASRGTLRACGDLVHAARATGTPVVHCLAEWRADRLGTPLNAPLFRALSKNPEQILAGSEAVELVEHLGDCSGDLRSVRRHGMTPFWGTDLDPLLRSMGTTHLVVCGVSLNVGIPGLVMAAVDRGYDVTVASDAVVGVPPEYGDAVTANTLAVLASLATVADLTAPAGPVPGPTRPPAL